MADQACLALEIPERLHRDNKELDPQFEESELLYRRIAKGYMREDLRAGFSLDQGESVNRQKYSKYPADVLFNIVNGQHRIGHAILAFEVSQVQQQIPRTENNEEIIYSFRVTHRPERCMYPHCEIEVRREGQLVTNAPPFVRKQLRDAIVDSQQRQVLINHPLPTD